jgi:hypothetical protein
MRAFRPFLIICLLGACRGSIDVSGLYVNGDFVPCDQPKARAAWRVSDSTLAARYRHIATEPHEPVFAHLQGIRADSGSIYGGTHHLIVQRILELRQARPGECRTSTLLQALGLASGLMTGIQQRRSLPTHADRQAERQDKIVLQRG